MSKLYFDKPMSQDRRCIEVNYTYNTKAGKPYTVKVTAIIKKNHLTLLNNTGSNIFDFRSVDKEFFIAFLQCLVEISQQKELEMPSEEE